MSWENTELIDGKIHIRHVYTFVTFNRPLTALQYILQKQNLMHQVKFFTSWKTLHKSSKNNHSHKQKTIRVYFCVLLSAQSFSPSEEYNGKLVFTGFKVFPLLAQCVWACCVALSWTSALHYYPQCTLWKVTPISFTWGKPEAEALNPREKKRKPN